MVNEEARLGRRGLLTLRRRCPLFEGRAYEKLKRDAGIGEIAHCRRSHKRAGSGDSDGRVASLHGEKISQSFMQE